MLRIPRVGTPGDNASIAISSFYKAEGLTVELKAPQYKLPLMLYDIDNTKRPSSLPAGGSLDRC